MDYNEQTDAFLFELQATISKFRSEFDLNHATIIGCLEMVKLDYLTDSGDVDFKADDHNDDEDYGDAF
ncbi:MAG: hypothetical protein CMI60_06160 [Parvibaculum sp.]|nr:hypothetical protein [Parvibaculum sp.]